jgi:hypothetical protein
MCGSCYFKACVAFQRFVLSRSTQFMRGIAGANCGFRPQRLPQENEPPETSSNGLRHREPLLLLPGCPEAKGRKRKRAKHTVIPNPTGLMRLFGPIDSRKGPLLKFADRFVGLRSWWAGLIANLPIAIIDSA